MTEDKRNQNQAGDEVKIFSIPFNQTEMKENISINTNNNYQLSKEEIINKAFEFHSQGNISEAAKYYQYCIEQNFNDDKVFCNYGTMLKGLGKLKEAEIYTRKAIEINPNFPEAHYNLGNILNELGKQNEAVAELSKA